MKLQLLLCLLCTINVALACFGSAGGKGSSGGKGPNDGGGSGNGGGGDKEPGAGDIGDGGSSTPVDEKEPLDKMGITPEDTAAYEGAACNPDAGSDNKNFDCNDAANCQWGNAAEPEDQLDWRTSSKAPNSGQWKKNFASTVPPDGAYFVTASKASPPEFSAYLVACSIKCASGDVLVGLGHWATENVKFEVCKQSAAGAPLESCAPVTEREGPSIVQVPGGSNFNIVIKASNFIDEAVGDVAVLDSLLLDFVACGAGGPNETTTTRPSTGNPDEDNCQVLNCNFASGLCGGVDASELVTNDPKFQGHVTKFEQIQDGKPYGNPVTGIPGPNPKSNDQGYLATNLDETNQFAGLKFDVVPNPQTRYIAFDFFEATEGIIGRVCFNGVQSEQCPFKTQDDTKTSDRQWRHSGPIAVPPDTHTIYVAGENKEVNGVFNHGVFGLDSVRYLSTNTATADNPDDGNVCTNPPGLAQRRSALQRRLFARRFSRHV